MDLEAVLWISLSILWWALSCTVLLPIVLLLKYNKRFSDLWFSWYYTSVVIPLVNAQWTPIRQQCFNILKEELKNRDPAVPLRVLEIGIAKGYNFPFYPENCSLIALDVNLYLLSYFQRNYKNYPNIHLENIIHGIAEDMKEVETASVDVVVATYVLCSVEDVEAALKEIKRVLVPGGKYLFQENVEFPENHWGSTCQKLVDPLYHLYGAGCHLRRDIAGHVESAGFSRVIIQKLLPPSVMAYVRPTIIGIALK